MGLKEPEVKRVIHKCGVLMHRGGQYVRMDNGYTTRCLNCGADIGDRERLGVLLT